MTGEKTEEPTEQRLREAREKGQTTNRKNVVEAMVIVVGVTLIYALHPRLFVDLSELTTIAVGLESDEMDVMLARLVGPLQGVVQTLIIFVFGLASTALFSQLFFNNFNFSVKSLEPKFEKFNPVNGIKGIFSLTTLYNFIRTLIIFLCICVGFGLIGWLYFWEMIAAAYCGITCLSKLIPQAIFTLILIVLLIIIVFAVMDLRLQSQIFRRQNKMTKDDVKREHKGNEGDPQIKGQRSSLAREDAVMPAPKDATHFIFGNGYGVAVTYQKGRPPFIIAKYRISSFERLVTMYKGYGVPVVEMSDVAQQFHSSYGLYQNADARGADGMVRVLESLGQLE